MELKPVFENVRAAGPSLLTLKVDVINEILLEVADAIIGNTEYILEENRKDLERMPADNPKYDRLKLTAERLKGIADDMRHVAGLPSPLGRELDRRILPNGLELTKKSVPFGVIGVIYEARPNVSFDVFSLCFKAGSACVLKGGSDAGFSNRAAVSVIHSVLEKHGVSRHVVELLPDSREAASELLHARGYVDLIIPRGSKGLIDFVRENARVPVIETGAGVCHTYIDASADIEMAKAVVFNAKTRRVSVCNALDCMIVNKKRIAELALLCAPLAEKNVRIMADNDSYEALEGAYPDDLLFKADDESFGTEFLDYAMAVKTVDNVQEAVTHISCYGSGHSECIVTEDEASADYFTNMVDAACVYVNAPTSFTDGAQFGLGAEIGISTQKLHARGPMALNEITTYKWIVKGNGQVRP